MEEEVLEGRGLAEEEVGLGGADSKAEAASEEEEEGSRVPEKGAVEVPLQELAVRPARGRRELLSLSRSPADYRRGRAIVRAILLELY